MYKLPHAITIMAIMETARKVNLEHNATMRQVFSLVPRTRSALMKMNFVILPSDPGGNVALVQSLMANASLKT